MRALPTEDGLPVQPVHSLTERWYAKAPHFTQNQYLSRIQILCLAQASQQECLSIPWGSREVRIHLVHLKRPLMRTMACLLERRAGSLHRRSLAAATRLRMVLEESGKLSACKLNTRNKTRNVKNYGFTPVHANLSSGVVGVGASTDLCKPVRFVVS